MAGIAIKHISGNVGGSFIDTYVRYDRGFTSDEFHTRCYFTITTLGGGNTTTVQRMGYTSLQHYWGVQSDGSIIAVGDNDSTSTTLLTSAAGIIASTDVWYCAQWGIKRSANEMYLRITHAGTGAILFNRWTDNPITITGTGNLLVNSAKYCDFGSSAYTVRTDAHGVDGAFLPLLDPKPQGRSVNALNDRALDVIGEVRMLRHFAVNAIDTPDLFGDVTRSSTKSFTPPSIVGPGDAGGTFGSGTLGSGTLGNPNANDGIGTPGVAYISNPAQTVYPASIVSQETFGTILSRWLYPSAITSQQTMGNATASSNKTLLPTSITSLEALGNAALQIMMLTLYPSSITTGEVFGTATGSGSRTVNVSGITSQETMGLVTLIVANTLSPSSITSLEAMGTATGSNNYTVFPIGISPPASVVPVTFIGALATYDPIADGVNPSYSLTANIPVQRQNGDLLIMGFATAVDGAMSPSYIPAGWTYVAESTNNDLSYYTKIWQTGDPDTVTINFNRAGASGPKASAVIVALRGYDPATPISGNVTTAGTLGSGSLTFNGITTTTDNSTLVAMYLDRDGAGGTNTTAVSATGFTTRASDYRTGGGNCAVWAGTAVQAVTGASGTQAVTVTRAALDAADSYFGILFAVNGTQNVAFGVPTVTFQRTLFPSGIASDETFGVSRTISGLLFRSYSVNANDSNPITPLTSDFTSVASNGGTLEWDNSVVAPSGDLAIQVNGQAFVQYQHPVAVPLGYIRFYMRTDGDTAANVYIAAASTSSQQQARIQWVATSDALALNTPATTSNFIGEPGQSGVIDALKWWRVEMKWDSFAGTVDARLYNANDILVATGSVSSWAYGSSIDRVIVGDTASTGSVGEVYRFDAIAFADDTWIGPLASIYVGGNAIPVTEAVGTPTVYYNNIVQVTGIASAGVMGTASLVIGGTSVGTTSITSQQTMGTAIVLFGYTALPVGITSGFAAGIAIATVPPAENIWTDSGKANPSGTDNTDGPVELGTVISAQTDIRIVGLRIYNHSAAQTVVNRRATLWDYNTQTALATVNIDAAPWSGWKEFYFNAPVQINNVTNTMDGSKWVVASATFDGYAYQLNALNTSVDSFDGNARIVSNSYLGTNNPGNSRVIYTAQAFPTQPAFQSSYYGVDILFWPIPLNKTYNPSGIYSGEAFGTPTIISGPVTRPVLSINSAEAMGTATLSSRITISTSSITTQEAMGTPTVAINMVTLTPSSITSLESFGIIFTLSGPVTVVPYTIGSEEILGTITVSINTIFLSPSSITSLQAFGIPSTSVGPITLFAISIDSLESFGVLSLYNVHIEPVSSIPVTEAIGTPSILIAMIILSPSSITSLEAFGFASTGGAVVVSVSGIASIGAMGVPSVLPGGLTLLAVSIDSIESLGVPTLVLVRTVQASSITSLETFGIPSLLFGALTVTTVSIDSAEAFGLLGFVRYMDALTGVNDFGTPDPKGGVQITSVTAIENNPTVLIHNFFDVQQPGTAPVNA